MLDKVLKYLPLASLLTILGFGLAAGKYFIQEIQYRERMEQRMHTDPKVVIEAEAHIEDFKEDKKQMMKFQQHVDEVFHELTQTANEIKRQRKQDSIIRMKDAVTNYQMKKTIDSINKYWKDYNAGQ